MHSVQSLSSSTAFRDLQKREACTISLTSRFPLPRIPRTLTSHRCHILDRIFPSSDSVAAKVRSSACTTTRTRVWRMAEKSSKLLCHVGTRHSPAPMSSNPPIRTLLFLKPYDHPFSLAYFPNVLKSSGNSTHLSSSNFALVCAFFHINEHEFHSVLTLFTPLLTYHSRVSKQCSICLSGGIAANQLFP